MQNFTTCSNGIRKGWPLSLLFITTIALIVVFCSCRKNDIGQDDPPKLPDQPLKLAHGNIIGEIVTATIGPVGGTLTIEVPAGAIDAVAIFSIQEVENVLKSNSSAYRLLPEGLNFKKPVKITYYYEYSAKGRTKPFQEI